MNIEKKKENDVMQEKRYEQDSVNQELNQNDNLNDSAQKMQEDKTQKNQIQERKIQESKILLLAGVSGVGKSTIIKKLVAEHNFYFGVSHTTRDMRAGETHGKDYHFVSKEEFSRLKNEDAFIETMTFADNEYGMSFSEIENGSQNIVLDLDYNGYKFVKIRYPGLVGIFLMHTDIEELKRRLEQREQENITVSNDKSNDAIASKLNTQWRLDAIEETMKEAKFFDHILDVTDETPDSILQKVLEKL